VSSPFSSRGPFVRATVINFFFVASLNGFVLLPLHIHALGGTDIEVGIVMGLYSAAGIVTQPVIGPWVDVVGRRPFMLFGVGLALLAALLAVVANGIAMLGVVRALQGVGFSAFFVASFAYVLDLVPAAERGWALGIYGAAGFVSTALAPLVGEWVIRQLGFRWLAGLSALIGGVATVLVFRLRPGPSRETVPPTGPGWRHSALADVLQPPMAVAVFFGLGTGTIFAFIPTFAESLGVRTLALFYTAYAAAAMGVRVVGGTLIDTRGRRAVIVPSMLTQTFATALLAALGLLVTSTSRVPVLPVLFLAGLLSGGAHGFLYPGLAALVTDRTPASRRGAVVGTFSAVMLVGQASGSFAFGYVSHALGYGLMWSSLTALLLCGFVLSLRLPGR
jgi:MFS family permease